MLFLLSLKCIDATDWWFYGLIRLMQKTEFRMALAVLVGFASVLLAAPSVIAWLRAKKIGDLAQSNHRDLDALTQEKSGTPTMGGILIVGALMLSALLFADLRESLVHFAMATTLFLALLGGFDDWLKLTAGKREGSRDGLRMWEKLLFQVGLSVLMGIFLHRHFGSGAAALVGLEGDIEQPTALVLNLPFFRTWIPGSSNLSESVILLPQIAFIILAIMMVAGTSNAVNLTDGMDGLAPGLTVVVTIAMMLPCWIAGQVDLSQELLLPYVQGAEELLVPLGGLLGATLGFLWFNVNPARVFMGDTGALAIGGLLGFVALAIRQELLFVLIAGVFFLNMASVILQVGSFRLRKGRRIFRCAPVHHHFRLGGWSEVQVVTRFWIVGVVLATVALVTLRVR